MQATSDTTAVRIDAMTQMCHQGPVSPGPSQHPCGWLSRIAESIVPSAIATIGTMANASAVTRGAGEPARLITGISSRQITSTGIDATTTSPMYPAVVGCCVGTNGSLSVL